MFDEIGFQLINITVSSGLIIGVGYIMRDTISKFLAKTVEHRFETKLETFKASIREKEGELDQIRSFLTSARRERDSSIQSKRLEAAETLMRARNALSQLSLLVEYMKILNIEQILKDGDNKKVSEFISTLIGPLEIDEKVKSLSQIDKTIPFLYLSSEPLKMFEAYQYLILDAAMMMKLFTLPIQNKRKFIKEGALREKILEIIPNSKEGFEKFGETYAYHWSTYLHDQILQTLRQEISGADHMIRDTESAERLVLDSRRAQINIHASLTATGLSDDLIK